ncbi:hypothetical protein VZT92_016970 [Zoarces viviparus]|uniref:Apolipophorin-III n=1 Tax=Zoarces viviparus TaxID=48416 RepID=A0AAW1ERC0_ZOAVI
MAAAALSSSRGVAGGLYILFTLLCLVCLASSWTYDEELKNIKEGIQKAEQHLKNVKAQRAAFSEFMSEAMTFNEAMTSFAEKVSEKSPDDSLPLKGILESARRLMEESKTYVDKQNELMDAEVADSERKLGELKTFVRKLEENQAEL